MGQAFGQHRYLMYLLDTNICIDYVDGRSPVARRRFEESFRKGLAISSITASELLVGARESKDPMADARRIHRFIRFLRCPDYHHAAAR